MPKRRPTLPFDLDAAMDRLAARDARLARLMKETARFEIPLEERSPYEVLLQAIAYQSISGKAAATIFGRVRDLSGNGRLPSPERMIALRAPVLRKAGLSAAKVLAMKDLARKTVAGIVPTLEQARALSDDDLIERLVSVRGIGVWSVEMFLIFRLGRPDVLPVDDLGVRKGWCLTYGKKHMPSARELRAFGERWRPYRTVASWYMWRACELAGPAKMREIGPAPRPAVKPKAR
ncbi:MAG TPA: DNA-3-methyladenine glycosylase 2 family protein [Burkholderiales bacterium]|nr:DNA-3-methyladenine glycosylase 2 family protein [Burkholderiales bacterium]